MHKATMWSHLFFWQKEVLSESCEHSNNHSNDMSFFFIQKSVNCCYISFYLLVLQTLYINNVFSFLIEQYFIDTLQNILKLFQGFWNTLWVKNKSAKKKVRKNYWSVKILVTSQNLVIKIINKKHFFFQIKYYFQWK